MSRFCALYFGAGNGDRTRGTKLGKLVLYQLSYARPYGNNKRIGRVSQEPQEQEKDKAG